MSSDHVPGRFRTAAFIRARDHPTGHDLIAVNVRLTGSPSEHSESYWRCRACGEERNRPDDFETVCPGSHPAQVVTDGGSSVEDDRVDRSRAQVGELLVRWVTFGPSYLVEDAEGSVHTVNIESETCRCEGYEQTGRHCEHLQAADQAIQAGRIPRADGSFVQ